MLKTIFFYPKSFNKRWQIATIERIFNNNKKKSNKRKYNNAQVEQENMKKEIVLIEEKKIYNKEEFHKKEKKIKAQIFSLKIYNMYYIFIWDEFIISMNL